jgi:hypothetical protein
VVAEGGYAREAEGVGEVFDEPFAHQRGPNGTAALAFERRHRLGGRRMAADAAEEFQIGAKIEAGAKSGDLVTYADAERRDGPLTDANSGIGDACPLVNTKVA